MNLLRRKYPLFSEDYKKAIFTLLCASRFKRGTVPRIPKNVLALIFMYYPEWSYKIDSGFILIVDTEGFTGWNLSNMIMEEYPTHGWKFARHMSLGETEKKAVIDTYVKAKGEPQRRAIALHGKKDIFKNHAIIKYCLTEAHFNAMTFIYVADTVREVPRKYREQIQKIYSPMSAETIAEQMSVDKTRIRKILSFMMDERARFYEYHVFGK